ncbi:MAG: hypothetical protein ACKOSS_00055, partial [Planctomycetia bacterium]
MIPEQQRTWIALLNLQRSWASDEAALAILPPAQRDFTRGAEWPERKALAWLLNHLELLRESHRRLEAGEPLDYDLLNASLAPLRLQLFAWSDLEARRKAVEARAALGGRLDTLRVTGPREGTNPGTAWLRDTVERCLWAFAQYADERLADPAYPGCSPGRWRVVESAAAGGDLVLEQAAAAASPAPASPTHASPTHASP